MYAFKVHKKDAEAAKAYLRHADFLAPHMHALREGDFVFFPVVKKGKNPASVPGHFVQRKFQAAVHTPSFREALVATLGPALGHEATAGYDTVGTTAIIEIAKGQEKYETEIARALLDSNRNIKTVLKKESAMQGKFRVREFKWLAGKRSYAVEYHESGCRMRFDLRKTYFSTRLATERNRIAAQVKPAEKVLALFAGVGPFALVIAKKQPSSQVVAIELNPDAARMMAENVRLNKTANVTCIRGDVRNVLKKYPAWADRACMPLPHTGYDFLDDVISAMKDGGIVHFYGFGDERQGVFDPSVALVEAAAKRQGVRCAIVEKRVVRPYAPAVFQVVIDFRVRRGRKAAD